MGHKKSKEKERQMVDEEGEEKKKKEEDEHKRRALDRFVAYLRANGMSEEDFAVEASVLERRYIRLNPFFRCKEEHRQDKGDTVENDSETKLVGARLVSSCLNIEEKMCSPVDWLPSSHIYAVGGSTRVACSLAYKSGLLYGIEASSAACVLALDPQPGDDVLDICCAPGAKYCFLADRMNRVGSVTGVDINRSRIGVARKMLIKYGIADHATSKTSPWRCRLFAVDGTTFGVSPPTAIGSDEVDSDGDYVDVDYSDNCVLDSKERARLDERFKTRKRKNKSWRRRERLENERRQKKRRRKMEEERRSSSSAPCVSPSTTKQKDNSVATCLYDRVLVDAECTHDGSVKHVAKFKELGWGTFERRVMDPERLRSLGTLQRSLIRNGYRLLKPGGTLVYSTCSLTRSQNEGVVGHFLKNHSGARLVPLGDWTKRESFPGIAGSLEHTVRFTPRASGTSGLFIAKIKKPNGDWAGA